MNSRVVSRRVALRALGATALAGVLPGCAAGSAVMPLPAQNLDGHKGQPRLVFATTRKPAGDGTKKPWFGTERGSRTTVGELFFYARTSSFASMLASTVNGTWDIDAVRPVTTDRPALVLPRLLDGKEPLLYTHGYNETFESAAISLAELADGIKYPGQPVLFSWPSRGALFDYGYDRESALWSRDALEDCLTALVQDQSVPRLHLVAHSMGTMLMVETLRQMRTRDGDALDNRFGAIVLAAPDIDLDLFTASLKRIGPLARRFTVIVSRKDRALELSSAIAGGARVGSASRDALEQLGVQVADASNFGSGLIGHDTFLYDKDVRAVVKRAIERAS
jgi:esterase/lipase superfamily enzyme